MSSDFVYNVLTYISASFSFEDSMDNHAIINHAYIVSALTRKLIASRVVIARSIPLPLLRPSTHNPSLSCIFITSLITWYAEMLLMHWGWSVIAVDECLWLMLTSSRSFWTTIVKLSLSLLICMCAYILTVSVLYHVHI